MKEAAQGQKQKYKKSPVYHCLKKEKEKRKKCSKGSAKLRGRGVLVGLLVVKLRARFFSRGNLGIKTIRRIHSSVISGLTCHKAVLLGS